MPKTLTVNSGLRTYSVEFTEDYRSACGRLANEGAFFVVDEGVWSHFGGELEEWLPKDRLHIVEPTEEVKTLDGVGNLVTTLSNGGVRRGHRLVAIGGGVIQDLVSFTASILYRGVMWEFFPTTLLGQADSCIGGKTSINVGERKNLVGNFWPPDRIFIDTCFLEALPEVEIRSGIGEILHYYVYAGSPLFDSLTAGYEEILADRALLVDHVHEALRIKKEVIEVDEFDKGERNKFNYGHTFGHALESITNFELGHGQAVTVGMCLANALSASLGYCDESTAMTLNAKMSVNLPRYEWTSLDMDAYLELLSRDKKNVDSLSLTCILMEDFGRLVKVRLPMDGAFRDRLAGFFAGELPALYPSEASS